MGSDWTPATLGEMADLKNGKGLKNSFYKDSGKYPVWGANGQIARTDKLLNKQPVIVIGRVGAYCGSIHAVLEPNWVTDNAIIARPKEGNDFGFLFYLLKHLRPEKTSIGSAQPLVTQTGLKILKHSKPPLPEQRAIAHILGSLDDKIELNRRMNRALEATAGTIFKSWFVDFDPVRAKAEGCPTGLPDEIAALFPDSFEDSEMGEIPKGWAVVQLEDVCGRITDGSHSSPKSQTAGYPMASVKDMHQWGLNLQSCRKISENDYHKLVHNDCKPLKNDVLIAKDGSYLKHIFVVNQDLEAVILSSIAILRPNDRINPHILCLSLQEPSVMSHMKNYVSGAVLQRIVLKDFRKFRILLPTEELQKSWFSKTEVIFNRIWINIEENNTLASLRDTLLPKLISGEMRIPDAEKFVEEAGL